MQEAVLLLAVLALGFVLWGIERAGELFCVRIREGRFELLRGRAPAALVTDFRDVLHGVRQAHVRAVVQGGVPTLRVRGRVSPEQAQRLRNVLGRFTTAQIRSAPRRR